MDRADKIATGILVLILVIVFGLPIGCFIASCIQLDNRRHITHSLLNELAIQAKTLDFAEDILDFDNTLGVLDIKDGYVFKEKDAWGNSIILSRTISKNSKHIIYAAISPGADREFGTHRDLIRKQLGLNRKKEKYQPSWYKPYKPPQK